MALFVKKGTYTGTGGTSGTRSITGIGFRPKVVFVWNDTTTQTIVPAFSYQSALIGLGSNLGYFGENGWVTATTADRFQSFDADGFTISIGSSTTNGNKTLNENGTTFYYLALGGDDVVTSSYTGNATDNRNITGVGFQPIWVFVMGGGQHQQHKFDSSGASTDSSSVLYNVADFTDTIQALNSDGFQVGANNRANQNAVVFYYFAIASNTKTYQSEYTGNASDGRSITGAGFTPDFVLIKSEAARNWALRSSDHSGDLSKFYRSSGFASDYIQAFNSDGFEVGANAAVNTSSEVYGFIAFYEYVPVSTLLDGLVSFYELDEASGVRVDAHASNHLADNATVTSAAGVIGDAAVFTEANTEYLSITDAAQSGLDLTGDMSFSFMYNATSLPQNAAGEFYMGIIDKWSVASNRSYRVMYQYDPVLNFAFITSTNGSAVNAQSYYPVTLTTGTWYHIVVTYDSSTGEVKWYQDAVNVETDTTNTGATYNGSSPFYIGGYTATQALDAKLDLVGIWSRVLTPNEATALSEGMSYADMVAYTGASVNLSNFFSFF